MSAVPEETVFLGPPGAAPPSRANSFKSPSERKLLDLGISPIRYIAGTEANARGYGKSSAEGNIYEVSYKGATAVAKVVNRYQSNESSVWAKINNVKKSIPKSEAKHLPHIYDILRPDQHTDVIIIELLQPTNPHISDVLRTGNKRGEKDLLKNEYFLSGALSRAFSRAMNDISKDDLENHFESVKLFDLESGWLKQKVEGDLLKSLIAPEGIAERITDSLQTYLNMLPKEDAEFAKKIASKIQLLFLSFMSPASRPIPKYYSPKGIDYTIDSIERNSLIDSGRRRQLDILRKERQESVYSERPEGFLYSEEYMPETKGIFSLLKTLNNLGIEWSDVHANNIMQRPSTGDLVLIDVGLFGENF
tara:strand:+ start:2406 stop:3494 length:1089 start_codon:yes stop_codon:yes gene_type:complete